MEDLPLIPAMKIIDYLSIENVLNLKLVNKWFYQFINENLRIKELVISTRYDHSQTKKRWFYTYDLVNLQNLFECVLDFKIYLNLNQPIIGQLKQLCIYGVIITLKTLNSLERLVHLEIIETRLKGTDNDVLSLPMLEILYLNKLKYGIYSSYRYNLLIDSAKLQVLKFRKNNVILLHPASITYLEVDGYLRCENFLPSCINLQHFYCRNLDLQDLNEFNLIKNLSKLKSIHLDESREAFDSLIKEKKRFNKDLKIYFHNFRFDELPNELPDWLSDGLDNNQLEELTENYTHNMHNIYSYYAENYSRLADHCPLVKSINYNLLEMYFNQIPENFIKKFVNLTRFIAGKKVNNPEQLIRMLEECKTITWLVLPSSLGQHFFDFRLYDLCPNIYELEICDEEVLNCEFILKFNNIKRFTVYQTESIEFARRLVESHESMNIQFNYFYNGDLFEIKITKYWIEKYKFVIRKECETILVLNSLDDLYKLESYLDTI